MGTPSGRGLGVYHGLRRTNLQHYLDEFVFRFNLWEIQSAERVVGFNGRQRSDYLRQLTTSRQMLIMSYKIGVSFM